MCVCMGGGGGGDNEGAEFVAVFDIPVKSYVFSVSLTDFRQFSSLTAYGRDLKYFREKMTTR